jgi:hypothetical protein
MRYDCVLPSAREREVSGCVREYATAKIMSCLQDSSELALRKRGQRCNTQEGLPAVVCRTKPCRDGRCAESWSAREMTCWTDRSALGMNRQIEPAL